MTCIHAAAAHCNMHWWCFSSTNQAFTNMHTYKWALVLQLALYGSGGGVFFILLVVVILCSVLYGCVCCVCNTYVHIILFSLCNYSTLHVCTFVLDLCMHHCLSFNLILQNPRQNACLSSQWEVCAYTSHTSRLERDRVSSRTISFQFDIEYSSSSECLTNEQQLWGY